MRSIFSSVWAWLKDLYHGFLRMIGIEKDDISQIDPIESFPDDPTPEVGEDIGHGGGGGMVCYYGCPNSKKAAKLQMRKKLYR